MEAVSLNELVSYADALLKTGQYSDYCPNGLQVEGNARVATIISGVTASQALVDSAIDASADLILVHHGYFWKGEDPRIIGIKRKRLSRLLAADVSLAAYHLPLDGHGEYGNNVQLGRLLGIKKLGDLPYEPGAGVVVHGELDEPVNGESFAQRIGEQLGREPLHVAGEAKTIRRIAWCTGGGQSFIQAAVDAGVDAYLTGEVSEQTVHIARENGLHFFAAGHHATERYGVQALGQHLAERFQIKHRFIDIGNPA